VETINSSQNHSPWQAPKRSGLPSRHEIIHGIKAMSIRGRIFLSILFGVFLVSSLGIFWSINNMYMVEVAASGGSFTEGVIGSPRFVNPLLAVSDADRDLTHLVYSGLVRPGPADELIPDLAEKITISDDEKTYTFILRDNLTWHDGKPVTTEDVEFTIRKAQDPSIKSPRRASWEGVTVEVVDAREIKLILKQPYASFLENATLGILPKHLWQPLSTEAFSLSEHNTRGVGTGPYKIRNVKRDANGLPQHYDLVRNTKFALGSPKIKNIRMRFYANERELVDALTRGDIDSINAISPETAANLTFRQSQIIHTPLPRVFGVFFNQNQSAVLTDKTVREALDLAVDRQGVVELILKGYGAPIDSPLPSSASDYLVDAGANSSLSQAERIKKARALLSQAGWKPNSKGVLEKTTKDKKLTLEFSLATSDTPELKDTIEKVKSDWEKLGAKVNIQIYELGELNQSIIRPRKYEALFFGTILGRDPDPFPFWHSSQRHDPGLNIALYASITADKLLEQARATSDKDKRIDYYQKFQAEIAKDTPAIFVYSPHFIYVTPNKIKGIELPTIVTPAERFTNVHNWYIKTDKVWQIFATDRNLIQ
jgi:peptide/nickel transport system substrate-binding protein